MPVGEGVVREHTVAYVTDPEPTPQRSRTGVIEAVEKSPLCHSEEARRPKNLNYKLQKRDPSLRSG